MALKLIRKNNNHCFNRQWKKLLPEDKYYQLCIDTTINDELLAKCFSEKIITGNQKDEIVSRIILILESWNCCVIQ